MTKYTFNTADFLESTAWVLQGNNNAAQPIIMSCNHNDDTVHFAYRDRTVFFESQAHNVISDNNEDNEKSENSNTVFIDYDMLSRFVKIVPKKASSVFLEEEFNGNGELTTLYAHAGNVKVHIPCVNNKKYSRPQVEECVEFSPTEFFPLFSLAGLATNNGGKDEQSVVTSVDLFIEDDKISIFGTDKYVINLSHVSSTVTNEEFFEEKIKGNHFLIPSHFSNFKNILNIGKSDNSATIISGKGKQKTLGFKFNNGYMCLFACLDIKHINAETIFDRAEKAATHFFTVDMKTMKTAVRNIVSLNPEAVFVDVVLKPKELQVVDTKLDNSISIPIESIISTETNEEDENFDMTTVSFSPLVINKMFNTIGVNSFKFNFTYGENGRTVFITPNDDITQSKIVTALYSKK